MTLDGRVNAKSLYAINKNFKKLETHYRDMQDVEFTVENNKQRILQTRSGKRTSKSAVKLLQIW